jgi:putative peptidoglycan lipid II flippase
MLSKLIRSGDMAEASRQLSLAVMLVLVFGLPAAVGLFCLAEQLISTIFEHGEFAAVDTAATAPALMAYAVGLPAFLLVKIFANCFYAAQDTKTPVRIAMLCVAINLCGNLIFMQYFEHVGLAMATSLAGWINAFLLSVYLYKRQLWTPSRQLMLFLLKSVLACTLMSVVILIIPAAPYFTAESLLYEKIVALTVLIFSGAGAYFLTLHMVHALPRGTIKAFLQKPPQHKRTD